MRKENAIPTVKNGSLTSGPAVEIVPCSRKPLPLYSCPALKDHNYADFITIVPESFEDTGEIDDAISISDSESEVPRSFDHSNSCTGLEVPPADRPETKPSEEANNFKFYR